MSEFAKRVILQAVDQKQIPDDAIRISDRSEAPEGATIVEGERGGLAYIPSGEREGGADVAGFDSLSKTQRVDSEPIETTFDDEAIFSDYISGGFNEVNSALRRPGENYSPEVQETIDTMDEFIENAPDFEEEVTVYRGLSASDELKEQFKNSEGEFTQLSGYQSTSHDPDIASEFTGDGDGVMLSINTDRGLPMYALDGVEDAEDEVVLGHDWYYTVENVTETDDGLIVELEA